MSGDYYNRNARGLVPDGDGQERVWTHWVCPTCDPGEIGTVSDPEGHEKHTGHGCKRVVTVPLARVEKAEERADRREHERDQVIERNGLLGARIAELEPALAQAAQEAGHSRQPGHLERGCEVCAALNSDDACFPNPCDWEVHDSMKNVYLRPFDYRLRDFTWNYRFHRRVGLVTSKNPDEDAPLGRWKSLKRACRDFLFRGPRLRRKDRVKYG